MFTLPGDCEFFSDAYLDAARAFLERESERRKASLGGKPFSVSERFTQAPPHLRRADNIAEWIVRYDGEKGAPHE